MKLPTLSELYEAAGFTKVASPGTPSLGVVYEVAGFLVRELLSRADQIRNRSVIISIPYRASVTWRIAFFRIMAVLRAAGVSVAHHDDSYVVVTLPDAALRDHGSDAAWSEEQRARGFR